jgi:uncharacterized protein YqeY
MSSDQMALIKSYIFSENHSQTKVIAESIKEKALNSLSSYLQNKEEHEAEKIQEVIDLISGQTPEDLNDETLTRFLQMTQIVQEIEGNQ